jgi:PEP-CTERM motif
MKLPIRAAGFRFAAAALAVSVLGMGARADVFSSTASTDAAVFGGAASSVSTGVETYNLRGFEDATGYTQTAVAFVQFAITDGTAVSGAAFNFDYKRGNSNITLNVYGLNDGDTADKAWAASSLEFDANGVSTPGAESDGGSPANPIVDPSRTTLLGTIVLAKQTAQTAASFTDANATGVTGATTLSNFLAADTNGEVTLLLVATAVGPFIYSTFSTTPETLSYTATPEVGAAAPEPASLGMLGLGAAALLMRRRMANEKNVLK